MNKMSLLQVRPIEGQILVSYSDGRKNEMTKFNDDSCSALKNLLRSRLQILGVKINKMLVANNRKGFADIVIEFNLPNNETLQHLKEYIEKLPNENVGVGKASLFVIRK